MKSEGGETVPPVWHLTSVKSDEVAQAIQQLTVG